MKFYFEKVEDSLYVMYIEDYEYPILNLFWCEECGCYHCQSDFFNFYEDYDCNEIGLEYEEDLLNLVKIDLIEDIKIKSHYMLEIISGLSNIDLV